MQQSIDIPKTKVSKSLILIPVLFLLMPSLPFDDSQYITYPILATVILGMVIISKKVNKLELDNNLIIIMTFLITLSVILSFSTLINYDNASMNALPQILKPLFFSVILFAGYFTAVSKDRNTIIKTLLRISYIFLIFQVIVGFTQLTGSGLFSLIYDDDKTQPLGKAVRIAGTMGNPNILAWFVIQMYIVIMLFEKRKILKFVSFIIVFFLVLFTGSRSFLLLLPAMLVFTQIFKYKRGAGFYMFKLPLIALGVYLIYEALTWFIFQIRFTFPYLYQLTNFLETGDLSSVNSYHLRTMRWEMGLNELGNSWFFGLGPGAISWMDNEFLYIIVNYGVIYLLVHLLMYLVIMRIFQKTKDRLFALLGIQYIVFSFIVGFQADTLVGWTYPILILLLTGVAIAIIKNNKKLQTSQ